ncbi:EndoU domain-containing protein [Caballeronia sp. LZ032]|uniref:EndoU domain-containing protein n=1 Tax=Caballeronia sp. LZ032 TaxID=3038565 RepID=UPI00285E6B11|nr:EndoU domain-containing protein [Caballeronia sp. LZ032]MDR5884302.1 EndoU domain-containing protein [Caballeronia sp. LZ032]
MPDAASIEYAQVKEQAGLVAGDGGFDVSVKGNTALTGAVIAGADDAAKNTLSTGTLTFADVGNHSHYSANSIGGSVGLSPGPSSDKAVGTASVPGSGGPVPMIGQHENGDQSATTRSAISPGTITLTDGDHQAQDIASLSRDMTNTNGTVVTTPDVNEILNQQADTMQAAQAAGQVVAQGIGAYADVKHNFAQANYDKEGAAAWDEGGSNRVIAHIIGGGLIGGLGGGSIGSAAGGAAGAGVSSAFGSKLNQLADGIGDQTGSMLAGNIAANVLAGLGGAIVGGGAGAAAASSADLYNRSTTNPEGKGNTGSQALDAVIGWAKDTYGDVPGTLSRWGNQIAGQMNADAGAKAAESPAVLIAQGIANGINAVIGTKGGEPPMANPGTVLADSTAGAAAGSAAMGAPGYVPSNAIFNGSNDGESGNNSLLDPKAKTHVLYGDGPTSGGHLSGVGKPGKSEFPPSWSPPDVTNAISDISTDPKTQWSKPSGNGYVTGTGTVNGVDIKVVVDPNKGRIVTGYPTNLPKNPK